MNKLLILFVSIFVISINTIHAETLNFDEFFSMVINYLGEDENLNNFDVQDLQEKLISAYDNPFNWNNVTRKQLEDLYFIKDKQIEELLFYADYYGPVHSISELQLVENIERPLLLLLPSVLCVRDIQDSLKWEDSFKHINHKIAVRVDYTPEKKYGFLSKKYYGSNFKIMTRYQISAGHNFKAALCMESDAGEPWFSHGAKGFDLYRGYLEFSNLSHLGTITLGSYKVSFGKGLLFGQRIYGNRLSQVLNDMKSPSGISSYGGTSETPNLNGIAFSIPYRGFHFSFFYSYSNLDADTTGGVWHTHYDTGLHRTTNEMKFKSSLSLNSIGANISYRQRWCNFGLSAYAGFFSLPAATNKGYSNVYDFVGKQQWGISLNYTLNRKHIVFSGETSLSQGIGVATSNSLQIYLLPELYFTLNYRYFSKKYHAFWSETSSSLNRVNSEHGASFAMKIPLGCSKTISFLAEAYKPLSINNYYSNHIGYELRSEFNGSLKRNINLYLSIRYRSKPIWYIDEGEYMSHIALENVAHLYCKLLYSYNICNFSTGFQTNLSLKKNHEDKFNLGWLIYQDVSFDIPKIPLIIKTRLALYEAPTWANRFYMYENDVPYSGFSPAMYGSAFKWYVVADYKFKFGLSASFRVSQVIYNDRNYIGSGLDKIDGIHKTDLHFCISYLLK